MKPEVFINMKQTEKILEMCYDNQWHCQTDFWRISKSPHKRRIEIEGRRNEDEPTTGRFKFVSRKCEHGISGSHDFLMVENDKYQPPTLFPKPILKEVNGKMMIYV